MSFLANQVPFWVLNERRSDKIEDIFLEKGRLALYNRFKVCYNRQEVCLQTRRGKIGD